MTVPQNPFPPSPFPQPAPAPKRGRRILVVVGATVTAFVLLCCGVGVAALNGDDKDSTRLGSVTVPSTAPETSRATPAETEPTPAQSETTPAEPAATTKAAAKPRVIKGRGDDVVDIPALTDLSVVVFDCRCSSNTVLKSDGPESLLVNEIGGYSGTRPLQAPALVEVTADGKWTISPS